MEGNPGTIVASVFLVQGSSSFNSLWTLAKVPHQLIPHSLKGKYKDVTECGSKVRPPGLNLIPTPTSSGLCSFPTGTSGLALPTSPGLLGDFRN